MSLTRVLRLGVLDDRLLRSVALCSKRLRREVWLLVQARANLMSHALRCALMLRPPVACVRCGVVTTQIIRQHRLPHKAMCRRCLMAVSKSVTFDEWLFLRRKRPYSKSLWRRGGRVWRNPMLRVLG